jgi:hypothetical protein
MKILSNTEQAMHLKNPLSGASIFFMFTGQQHTSRNGGTILIASLSLL